MTRVLSATVMSAKTTRTRRRLSSQRNPWLKDGEADGPIKRSSSTGFIRSLLSGVCGDQSCFSMMGHLKRDARAVSPRACAVVWFFPNDTWRSAHLHPGKPAYFAPATLIFCFWERPYPTNSISDPKTREAEHVLLSLPPWKGTILLRTLGRWRVFLFGHLHALQCLGKPLVNCSGGDLSARGKPELGEDMRDMRLHGADSDDQPVGDGTIGFALGHQARHLALTGGQSAEVLRERAPWRKRSWRLGQRGARWHNG